MLVIFIITECINNFLSDYKDIKNNSLYLGIYIIFKFSGARVTFFIKKMT
jgi:CRISPR/Cas system CMR-associated protein Cmr3 (group 5 of RAMP superfamily)